MLYDDQFSLARTPAQLEQRHRASIQTCNTTAHQGLLKGVLYPTRFGSMHDTLIPLSPTGGP
jgi:hypothetical protein